MPEVTTLDRSSPGPGFQRRLHASLNPAAHTPGGLPGPGGTEESGTRMTAAHSPPGLSDVWPTTQGSSSPGACPLSRSMLASSCVCATLPPPTLRRPCSPFQRQAGCRFPGAPRPSAASRPRTLHRGPPTITPPWVPLSVLTCCCPAPTRHRLSSPLLTCLSPAPLLLSSRGTGALLTL